MAVDNPKGTVQFGGTVAAPIVGNMIGDSLRVMGVEPRKDQIEKELKWNDPLMVEVPDLVGISKREIRELMVNLKIDSSGEGEVVVKQTPKAGVKIKEGSVIRLYFGESKPTKSE